MILPWHAFVAIGAVLLVLNLLTLGASRAWSRWVTWIGIAAGAVAGLGPLAFLLSTLQLVIETPGSFPWTLAAVVLAFLVAFVIYAVGVLGIGGNEPSMWLRRLGYAGLLILVAIPSTLLLLAPFVAIAGIGLWAPVAQPVRHSA